MTEVLVRPSQPGDIAALADLIAGFRDHLNADGPSDAEIRAHLPGALRDPTIEFACAWLSGEAPASHALYPGGREVLWSRRVAGR